MPNATDISLSPSVLEELQARVRSRSLRAEDSRRSRLILMLANGESYTSICRALDCDPSYVSRWKKRFMKHGLSGLYSHYHGRKVQAKTPSLEARILNWTEVLGSERLTGAVLDRLTHRCHIIEMSGESYRLKDAKRRRKKGQPSPIQSEHA